METDPTFPPTLPASLPSAPPLQLPGPTPDALLLESNMKLLEQMHLMQATYKQELDAQMQAFREQAFSEFAVIRAERDAAKAQVEELKTYIDSNKASTSQNRDSTPQSESNRAHRPRPGPTKLTGNAGASTRPPARKRAALNSSPLPTEQPSKNNPRPPVTHVNQAPGSSSQAPEAAGASIPSSSRNTTASSTRIAATKAPKKKKDRRLREHQIIQSTLDKAAQSLKKGLECHVRFLWGILSTRAAPVSASAQAVAFFNQRFSGLNVAQLKQQGQMGQPIVNPAQVKVGLDIRTAVRSTSKILKAFAKIEESALLHMRAYISKLGLNEWAPDYEQSPYSQYNVAMRICAIDLFRYLTSSTFYDFLRIDSRYLNDVAFITRLYDHFVHHYMYQKWEQEVRSPGASLTTVERNTASANRKRLYKNRLHFGDGAKIPPGIKMLLHAKATSDTESTPSGPRALACPERSVEADRIIRTIDKTMIDTLRATGKTREATMRSNRKVPELAQRQPSQLNVPAQAMPIQYYSPVWWNRQPEVLRRALKPSLVVVFAPSSVTDFFSHKSETACKTVTQLTSEYGHDVFKRYDLEYLNARKGKEQEAVVDEMDEDGESTGSHEDDRNEEGAESDSASMAEFIDMDEGSGESDSSFADDDGENGYLSDDSESGSEEEGEEGESLADEMTALAEENNLADQDDVMEGPSDDTEDQSNDSDDMAQATAMAAGNSDDGSRNEEHNIAEFAASYQLLTASISITAEERAQFIAGDNDDVDV